MALPVLRLGATPSCSSESAFVVAAELTSSSSSSSRWIRGAQPLLLRVALGMADKKLGGTCGRVCGGLRVRCIGWDPEGILSPPQGGHITRRTLEKLMQAEGAEKETIEKQASLERERRRAAREARIVPETNEGFVEFFMQTEAQDFDFEIARCRLRLNGEFFSYLQQEVSSLRFSLDRTKDAEDRLLELEALQKVLIEGTEAYDKLSLDLVGAKAQLAKILASKDKRATLLEMVAKNELDRSLLALLDQNIATANVAGQEQASKFMEKIRSAVLKYISV